MAGTSRTPDDAFRVARSLAIEQYARLESALCVLFASLAGMKHARAAIIFYKIGHAGYRNNMIDLLIADVHGESYSRFWDTQVTPKGVADILGFWNFIGKLDSERNDIVHWHPSESVSVVLGSNQTTTWHDLRPAFATLKKGPITPLTRDAFNDFIARSEYAEQMVNRFYLATAKPKNLGAELQTWLDIFGQPHAYPPTPGHPIIPLLPRR